MKVIVIYYSRGGVTKKMAEIITQELKDLSLEVDLFGVDKVNPKQLLDYQGIIVGSPTYYGTVCAEIKELLDKSVSFHGKLDGKVGAAFTSSANVGGGNETTLLSILEAMLIHGMVIQGDWQGDHYGPVAVSSVDERARKNCLRFAKRFADLIKNKMKVDIC